jgi:hypothetical protein
METSMSRRIRDLTAAATGAVVILMMLIGHKGGGAPSKPSESGTPDIGVYYADERAETAPDRFAPSGDSTATSTSPSTTESPTRPKPTTVVQSQNAPDSLETPSANSAATNVTAGSKEASTKQNETQTPTEVNSAATEKSVQPPNKGDPAKSDMSLAQKFANQAAEPTLPPTAVEPEPKKVSQMSPGEIQKALENYKGWVHRGHIRVLVDHSLLTSDQLRSVAQAYVMTTKSARICINQNGRQCELPPELIANLMIGDVPPSKWPQMLIDRAHYFFGDNHGACATLLFSDSVTLQLFRNLAHYVGDAEIPPGTSFTLRLAANEKGMVNVESIDASVPGRSTEDLR